MKTLKYYLKGILCIVFSLQATILNAQLTAKIMHIQDGIVQSFYALPDHHSQQKNTYCHLGRTITVNGKTYPFYVKVEDNASIRRFINPKDTADYKQYINEDFALDAQKGVYKYDLGLSPFEYTYDGNIVSSSGCWYYSKKNYKQLIACYYFSGDVILYHVDVKKRDIESHFWVNRMLQQKTFIVIKEATTLKYIPLKITESMGLRNIPIFSIFRVLDE